MSSVTDSFSENMPVEMEVERDNLIHGFGDEATWRQTIANALVITRREVRDSFRDWRIVVPIFILTLCFPFLANVASNLFVGLFEEYGDTPENLADSFLPLMPMLVGFFPMSISLVIALETFVGEKERRSLEPLLATPLTNVELYMGKVLSATITPLMAAYLGVGIYLVGVIFGSYQWRPEPELILLILAMTTVQGIVMVTGAVVISSQTTSTRAANLLASVIILPMSLLVIVESLIMIQPSLRYVLWIITLGLLVVVVLLVRAGARMFNREELLGRSVDQLNIKRAATLFVEQFSGLSTDERKAAKERGELRQINLFRWYRRAVFPSIKSLRHAMLAIAVGSSITFLIGFGIVSLIDINEEDVEISTNEEVLAELDNIWGDAQSKPHWVLRVVEQNMRVLSVVTFLALFTFGVMAMLPVVVASGIIGGALGIMVALDMNILLLIFGILPHGIFEIPAIVIACAAGLRAGAIVSKPPVELSVFEAWLMAIADLVKLMVALVIPLLFIGGIVEVTVTPRVIEWLLETL
jgi:uncharacterized membrane protein SpoIIM required for sporulation/ABC-type transport system involved in multi-copper enzyme maturation permease subunit